MSRVSASLLLFLVVALCPLSARAQEQCPSGALIVGTDATFPPFSSKEGERFVGYEIDLVEQLAKRLGCTVQWVNSSFDGIFPALLTGKYDMVIASVTITEERKQTLRFGAPYIQGGLGIVGSRTSPVRPSLEALRGLRVGVGLNTTGQFLLEGHPEIVSVKYPSIDLALSDLQNARLEAVIGDIPVVRYYLKQSFPSLRLEPGRLQAEEWGMVYRPDSQKLQQAMDAELQKFIQEGALKGLEARYLGDAATAPSASGAEAEGSRTEQSRWEKALGSLPLFLAGTRWTLFLALLSFASALPLGLLVAIGRLSPHRLFHVPAGVWVELLRGTPLLVQLFFIYYVLPGLLGLSLTALTSAVLALSINASAYICEIFRAALQSIDSGQGEASVALGLSRAQTLRFVLVPQALRRAVPPLTNECIALLKESSLVSVMGMTELTRTGQELAGKTGDPLAVWPIVAALYFIVTFPLARLSSWLERRLETGNHR